MKVTRRRERKERKRVNINPDGFLYAIDLAGRRRTLRNGSTGGWEVASGPCAVEVQTGTAR